ncbi:unnamed protein product [Acanthoscelides obtectus]|uniref:Uncharacterized protein n=1 Tax=Acanthoscelides obtectus TaxID=200917 RepID=A0A9P0KD33_ACAOB|nr:unnamed protein product [Acanthoscelides obtectus]CAK1668771.1 hypothetical protein AOBTE_LOCUS26599 [Acanthoscelides obtectus]
MAIIANFGLKK